MKRLCVLVLVATVVLLPGIIPAESYALDTSPEVAPFSPLLSKDKITSLIQNLTGDDVHAFAGFTPEVIIAESLMPNAYARDGRIIVLTRGLMDLIRSEDELAFVISHELGHLMLHRSELQPNNTGQSPPHGSHRLLGNAQHSPQGLIHMELEADSFAQQLLARSPYDSEVGCAFLERLALWGSEFGVPLGTTRPSLQARISELKPTPSVSK